MKLELVINKDVVQGRVNELIESVEQRNQLVERIGVLAQKSRGEVHRPIGKYKGMKWFSTKTSKSKWSDFTYTHTYITTKGRKEIAELYNEVMQAQEINA